MKVKSKKNLTNEDRFKLEEYERRFHTKGQMLDNGDIIAIESTEDQQIVLDGWAQSADEITDRMRIEYRKFNRLSPKEENDVVGETSSGIRIQRIKNN